jgi:hypothetical protein
LIIAELMARRRVHRLLIVTLLAATRPMANGMTSVLVTAQFTDRARWTHPARH